MKRVAAVVASLLAFPAAARAQLDAPPEPVLPPPPSAPVAEPAPPVAAPAPPVAAPASAPQATTVPPAALIPPPPSPYQSTMAGHHPSPEWTQDRSFTSTRFWLLDPGRFEAQVWFRSRFFRDVASGPVPAEHLLQAEVEIGLAPHLQLDLYENLTFNASEDGRRGVQQEGNQIELRIAIPSYYGQIFGNPVIYLEWHPRHSAPDRAEARLLLGGAPTRWLYLALNPYVESNIETTTVYTAGTGGDGKPTVLTASKWIYDMEFGLTVALGFRITDWLRLSAEAKVGADMLGSGDNTLHFVAWAGPGFIVKPLRNQHLKIMGTCLFGLAGMDAGAQQYEPLFIVGSQF